MSALLALPQRRFHPRRYRPGNVGTWSGHLPFANDLVWAQKPKLLVELGTHYGESYFGFCQAAEESGAGTRCFAIDTWKGDEHAGFYGEEVYQDVERANQPYRSFSTLLRDTFDNAREQFEPGSIDLLHIDGLHTYDTVKHDFEQWYSQVKPGGVVLLHDITVRHANFEVWRLWEELSREHPHFEFHHSWGLGVILKPGGADALQPFLQLLFQADKRIADAIRTQYSEAAELLEFRERGPGRAQAAAEADRPYLQVFPGRLNTGFQEKQSVVVSLESSGWHRYVVDLAEGVTTSFIRIDPVNRPAYIEIFDLSVKNLKNVPLLEVRDPRELSGLFCAGDLMPLASGDVASFFSWGNDPQLILRLPEGVVHGQPLRVTIAIRVRYTLELVRDALLDKRRQ